jgi:hypothetical protein
MPETIVIAKRFVLQHVDQYFWSIVDPGEPSSAPALKVNEFPAAATEEKISPLNFSATPYAPYSASFDYRDYRDVLNFLYGRYLFDSAPGETLQHVGNLGVAITDTVQETGQDYDID